MTKLLAKQKEYECRLLENRLALEIVKLEVLESYIENIDEVSDVESLRKVGKWFKDTNKSNFEVSSLKSEKKYNL